MGSCFGTQKPRRITPQWYDPLGPSSVDSKGRQKFEPSGAVEQRRAIFSDFNKMRGDLRNSPTADAAAQAAANPGWSAAGDLATRTLRGDYLNGSPALDDALGKMRAATVAEGANNAADQRSQFARNGLSFSTANQQAQNNATTAGTASANAAEAGARANNYMAERQLQTQAPQMLEQATSQPLNYLQLQDMAKLIPLSQMAQIIAGLAGQGQVIKPDLLQRQSKGRQFTAAAGEIF